MKRWTEKRIREYIESHDENDTTPHDYLVAMFRTLEVNPVEVSEPSDADRAEAKRLLDAE